MGYMSRQPTSNDRPLPQPSNDKNPWLEENDLLDEVALLLNGSAKKCVECKRTTRVHHLDTNKRCPDCR